jgi:spermidine synthase
MIVELAAVRLLAPWFGTSLVVWTNVIAVILLALAVGYLLGARLSARRSPVRILGWTLLAAGALVVWLPRLSVLCAPLFVPAEIALEESAGLVLWGSLALALLVFLPPAVLLGTVCPLAVEAVAEARRVPAGTAGGVVLATSTLGSLAGVFGTSHLLLPRLGLTGTFLLAGATLAGAGAAALFLGRRGGTGGGRDALQLLFVGLVAAGLLEGEPEGPPLAEGFRLLARRESRYQSLRVVEDRTREPMLRLLQVNEGFDSFQSVWQPEPGLLPEGFYYNDSVLPLAWAGAAGPWRVLVLGLGAGTVLRVIEGASPPGVEPHSVGVELDPEVVALGREFFDLVPVAGEREIWGGLDARVALRVGGSLFDQIVLDCYANQVEIPAHLCTREFFAEARGRLAPGGWLVANLGGFGFDDPVVVAVARTCARAFGSPVLLLRVPHSRNFTLVARHDAALPLAEDGTPSGAGSAELSRLLSPRALPGFFRLVDDAGPQPVLSDDRCPIELLQLRSIREGRERRRGET